MDKFYLLNGIRYNEEANWVDIACLHWILDCKQTLLISESDTDRVTTEDILSWNTDAVHASYARYIGIVNLRFDV